MTLRIVTAPDTPFLHPRDTAAPTPAGWVTEPAGRWAGAPTNVAYDPRRHTVLVSLNRLPDKARAGLRSDGWVWQAGDGCAELWVRDRLVAARTALDRSAQTAGVEIAGRGL